MLMPGINHRARSGAEGDDVAELLELGGHVDGGGLVILRTEQAQRHLHLVLDALAGEAQVEHLLAELDGHVRVAAEGGQTGQADNHQASTRAATRVSSPSSRPSPVRISEIFGSRRAKRPSSRAFSM